MNVSTVELRQNMSNVLTALSRRESITVFRRGTAVGVLHPIVAPSKKSMRDHPFFGMKAGDTASVQEEMDKLRGGRYRDI